MITQLYYDVKVMIPLYHKIRILHGV